ncbi:hypothetical protein ACMXYQ_14345 [Neptuniibacter sp. PT34_22]|uniref:hypothetical protein n=1 Tax=Neptuniibacter sp. PT34_22 TaxID=3398205 RepID=UPI0039F4F47C
MDVTSISTVLEVITSGDWTSIAILIVFVCLAQARRIIDSFDYIRDRKIRSISGLLDLERISDETKYVLEESLDQISFLRTTGISTDYKGRKKITEILRNSEGDITVLGLRKVSSYVRHEGGEVRVLVRKIDRAEAIWNFITFVLILYLLGSLITNLALADQVTPSMLLSSGIVFLFGLVVLIFPVRTMNAFTSALDVRDAFKRYEEKQKEANK